jgi:hypothetical protein
MALSALNGDTKLCPIVNSTTRKLVLSIIFDTGASLAITPELSDFVEPPKRLSRPMRLGGMTNGTKISGNVIIAWTFTAKDGTQVQIRTEAYYVTASKRRLLSTQCLFNKKKGIFGTFSGDEDKFELDLNNHPVISVCYGSLESFPVAEALWCPEPEPALNISMVE